MKRIMLIINLILFTFFVWNCVEKTPLEPNSIDNNTELQKHNLIEVGAITPFLSLDQGNSTEGITIDWRGKKFISNTRDGGSTNEVLVANKNGSWRVYATLPGSGQARGLAADLTGNVYVAFATNDPKTNGVYKIRRSKSVERLQGSEDMVASNALTFDQRGNLYATDSDGGSIWKYGKNKRFVKWFEHQLLVGGIVPGGPPIPLPGANGIAFYPPNKLYVANTAQNSIALVRFAKNGNPTGIELIKQDFLLMNIDGIAIDLHENIYGVLPPSTLSALGLPPLPPLIKLNPKSGEILPLVQPINANQFNTPTSIAFGNLFGRDGKSVFIANAALQYGQPMEPWSAPGVVKVYVGKAGF